LDPIRMVGDENLKKVKTFKMSIKNWWFQNLVSAWRDRSRILGQDQVKLLILVLTVSVVGLGRRVRIDLCQFLIMFGR
jgi:hypothetical protein